MRLPAAVRSCVVPLVLGPCLVVPVFGAAKAEVVAVERLEEVHLAVVSRSGAAILQHIENAREALRQGNRRRALHEVASARAELNQVRSVSHGTRVQSRIDRAIEWLTTSEVEKSDQALLPIFQELDAAKDVVALAETRGHVEKARVALAKGDREEARTALVAASAVVVYTEIDLPVEATSTRLNRALLSIRHHDIPTAEVSLREAAESVSVFVKIAATRTVEEVDVGAGPQ